jgi:hypothetical protein
VAISTEKIIPFNSENHKVVGGNKHNKINIQFPPELTGEDEVLANADGAIMQTGPKIYIPANTHPHLGICLVSIQAATPSKAKPAKANAFDKNQLAVLSETT